MTDQSLTPCRVPLFRYDRVEGTREHPDGHDWRVSPDNRTWYCTRCRTTEPVNERRDPGGET